jgi:hypothetical protein
MTVFTPNPSEIAGIQIALANTLEQINCALDRGDKRAFRAWSKRWASLSARAGTVLVELVTAEV